MNRHSYDHKGTAEVMTQRGIDPAEVIQHTDFEGLDIITANMNLLTANLEVIQEEASKSGLALSDMFSSSEAGKAAMSLLSNGVDGFNSSVQDMENGISNATETAALMALSTIHHQQAIADLQGETATVTLKNTQQYPFNNSTQSVALKTERNHMDYTVETEIVDYTGGFPGDIVITEKLLNGFKMAHTGSAKSVTVKVYVKGGFY